MVRDRLNMLLRIAGGVGTELSCDSMILDFGCGDGRHTLSLRRMGYRAFGCDVVNRCDEAATTCRALTPETVFSFTPLSPYRLPYPDETFDFVLSDHVLEHVLNYEDALREMKRVLKRTGTALHIFPSRYRLLESHLKVPLGGCISRQSWFTAWALLGIGYAWHRGLPPEEVGKHNAEWIHTRVNYLPKSELMREFQQHFDSVSFVEHEAIRCQTGLSLPLLPTLLSTFHVRVVALRRCKTISFQSIPN